MKSGSPSLGGLGTCSPSKSVCVCVCGGGGGGGGDHSPFLLRWFPLWCSYATGPKLTFGLKIYGSKIRNQRRTMGAVHHRLTVLQVSYTMT